LSKKENNTGFNALKTFDFGDKKRDRDDETVGVAAFTSLS
jgi:hypothetical protein